MPATRTRPLLLAGTLFALAVPLAAQPPEPAKKAADPKPAAKDSFEHWLVERYALFVLDGKRRVWRGDVHHRPWPLYDVDVEIRKNTMGEAHGLTLPEPTSTVSAPRVPEASTSALCVSTSSVPFTLRTTTVPTA